jgi:putative MFS transporter
VQHRQLISEEAHVATTQSLSPSEMNVLRRLERLPISWVQGRLLIMGGLGYTFDAMDGSMVAFLLPPVTALWALSNEQTGLLGSSILIGYLFGAFFSGTLGDIIGRRAVMMYALAIYCLATLVAALSPSWEFMFWSRAVAGFGTGAESAIIAPFLSEFIASKYRGRYVGSLSGFFSFGYVFGAILGWLVVPASPEGWRIVQVITAMPIVMLLWWRRSLPESPRWLMQHGRLREAEETVAKMEAETIRRGRKDLPPLESVVLPQMTMRTAGSFLQNVGALWGRSMAKSTLTLWILWISITFVYYGFFTWIPSLLIKMGMTVTKSFGYSIIINVAQIPGYYTAAFLSEKLDRKWTIVLYMLGGGVSAYFMSGAQSETLITTWGFCMSFFMSGVYSGLYAYTPEVYPTSFRTTGMGTASSFGRIGGIAAPIIIGATYSSIGFAGVFSMNMGVLIIAALVVALLGARTSGKTLEQITAEEIGKVAEVKPA